MKLCLPEPLTLGGRTWGNAVGGCETRGGVEGRAGTDCGLVQRPGDCRVKPAGVTIQSKKVILSTVPRELLVKACCD